MIDPKSFVVAIERGLHKGQRVRTRYGPGVIELIWFGIEEQAKVILDDGTQRDCGLEMDDVWLETKETMKMNVEQNYDAVEGKGVVRVEPRRIGIGDVLWNDVNEAWYEVYEQIDNHVGLADALTGRRWGELLAVANTCALTRDEATQLCARLSEFRLVGRAKDVVTVNDPGE